MTRACGRLSSALLAAACLVIVPTTAQAQSAIAGTVKDASGAVLPGVTVEASSPVLIEKVRTVDDQRSRPIPHRRSAARRLPRDLHALRVQHVQARRPRAAVRLHRHAQRGAARSARSRKRSRSPASRRSSTSRARRASRCSTARRSTRSRPAAPSTRWRSW